MNPRTESMDMYPEPLRTSVTLAGSVARALSAIARREQLGDGDLVWLIGRDDEVRVVVQAVLADWRAGILDTGAAVAQLNGYLEELQKQSPTGCRLGRGSRTRPSIAT